MIYQQLARILLLALIAPRIVIAQTAPTIAITEIGAHETSNNEWVEIYNYGSASVDLTGWKFFEDDINHGISAPSDEMVLPAGTYAIIADVADNFLAAHPQFDGIVFDSAWTTLSLSGEAIGLKDAQGAIIELFTYPEVGKTSLQRQAHDSDEWSDHPDGDSAGAANVFASEASASTPLEQTITTPNSTQPSLAYRDVLMTELVADPLPDEKEWVELFNPGSTDIQLDGLVLVEESGKPVTLTGTLKAGAYHVHEYSSAKLNNSGDTLTLESAAGVLIDRVAYGTSSMDNLPAPEEGQSLARAQSGEWYVSNTITKQAANVISQEIVIEGGDSPITSQAPQAQPSIVFNEVYANPIGSDRFHEFIEFKNPLDTLVVMEGWVLKDNDNVRFVFPKVTLLPNELFVVERRYSNLALDNTGDTLTLLNEKKEVVTTLTVPAMLTEHQSYQNIDGVWELTSQPTKGEENMFYPLNTAPVLRATCTQTILVHEPFTCDASDSYDPLNDPLIFEWRLSTVDNTTVSTSSDDVATFTITEPIKHELTLSLFDGIHTTTEIIPLNITTPLRIANASTDETQSAATPTTPKKSIDHAPPQLPEPIDKTSEKTLTVPEARIEPEPLNIAISDERPDRRYQFGAALAIIALALGIVLRMRTLAQARAPSRTPAGTRPAHERPPSQFYSLE